MKPLLHIVLFCFTSVFYAQKITEKTFPAKGVSSINIIGEYIFSIQVETEPINEIKVQSRIEGEHNENVALVTKINNSNFNIEAKFQPIYNDPNDKLSAHKVISIELVLTIPENLNLLANLYSASAHVKGRFKKVLINSDSGNCFLDEFKGDAKVFTRDGHVNLTTNHAIIKTNSINGFIREEDIDSGKHKIEINTINGNITITKSQ